MLNDYRRATTKRRVPLKPFRPVYEPAMWDKESLKGDTVSLLPASVLPCTCLEARLHFRQDISVKILCPHFTGNEGPVTIERSKRIIS